MKAYDNILQWIEAWVRGELGAEETAELERRMAEDPEFAVAVQSYKEAFDVLDETSWDLTEFDPDLDRARYYLAFYTDETNRAYLDELKALSAGGETRRPIISIRSVLGAAAVAAAIVLAVVFLRDGGLSTDHGALYAEYAALEEIPTFTVRGTADSVLSLLETQFRAGNYVAVSGIIHENEDRFDDAQLPLVAIYEGVALTESGSYEEAYDVLKDRELFANSIYHDMAQWYLALTLLRDQPGGEQTKAVFRGIADDETHYKQTEAKRILRKL